MTGAADVINDFVAPLFQQRFPYAAGNVIESFIPGDARPLSCAALAHALERETNPLVLISVLCLSFALSAILIMLDFSPPAGQTNLQLDARRKLEPFYKDVRGPQAPYQQHLRAAQQAFSRGDIEEERAEYRKVLALLRAEKGSKYSTVTRTPGGDQDLENLLVVLLREE